MSAIAPVAGVPPIAGLTGLDPSLLAAAPAAGSGNFSSFLAQSLQSMETKVAKADQLVKAFALDENIPVHQVTFALEEAKLAVELAVQVRTRLLEGYRELMNMQL